MAATIPLTGYYYQRSGGITPQYMLYAAGTDPRLQDEARQAMAVVLTMIEDNENAAREIEARHPTHTHATRAILDDRDFFLISMSMMRVPVPVYLGPRAVPLGAGGFSPAGNGCCNGAGEDEAKAMLLIAVIGVLLVALVATVALAVSHGKNATEAKRKLDEINRMKQTVQNQSVKDVFAKIAWEHKKEVASQSLKTLFTSTAAVGVTCLTIAATIALYAVFNKMPVPPIATPIAIGGGAIVGGSLAAHGVRSVTLAARKGCEARTLSEIYDEILTLGAPHPYTLLRENETLEVGNIRYIRKGNAFSQETIPSPGYNRGTPPRYADFTNYSVAPLPAYSP